jgi:outer membrane protein assembly factor BamB
VDGDLVFGLSSKGMLMCVQKADGKPVWHKDLLVELKGEVNPVGGAPLIKLGWGYSWSPQVDGDNLLIAPGGPDGLLAALNKKTGALVWRSTALKDKCTYSSPLLATLGGVKQVLYLVQNGLVSVDAKDGTLLWQHRRDDPYEDVVCPTPIVRGDRVYISVGYAGASGGSQGLKVTGSGKKFKVEVVFTEKVIGNKQGGVVLVGDHVYGYHEDRNWACQEFTTGALAWPKKTMRQAIGAGSVLAADGRLYVLDEKKGIVGMLAASPAGYKVLSQFKLPRESSHRKSAGHIWTHPSLSDGKLYLRDQELVFCYQVK